MDAPLSTTETTDHLSESPEFVPIRISMGQLMSADYTARLNLIAEVRKRKGEGPLLDQVRDLMRNLGVASTPEVREEFKNRLGDLLYLDDDLGIQLDTADTGAAVAEQEVAQGKEKSLEQIKADIGTIKERIGFSRLTEAVGSRDPRAVAYVAAVTEINMLGNLDNVPITDLRLTHQKLEAAANDLPGPEETFQEPVSDETTPETVVVPGQKSEEPVAPAVVEHIQPALQIVDEIGQPQELVSNPDASNARSVNGPKWTSETDASIPSQDPPEPVSPETAPTDVPQETPVVATPRGIDKYREDLTETGLEDVAPLASTAEDISAQSSEVAPMYEAEVPEQAVPEQAASPEAPMEASQAPETALDINDPIVTKNLQTLLDQWRIFNGSVV